MKLQDLKGKKHGYMMDIIADWIIHNAGDCGSKSFAVLEDNGQLELVPLTGVDADKATPLIEFKYTSKGMKYSRWDEITRLFERVVNG